MNNFNFSGRLTKDPEIIMRKNHTTGEEFASVYFTVYVFRKKNNEKDFVYDFIPCSATGVIAERIVKLFKAKSKGLFNGQMRTQNTKDENGKNHYFNYCNITSCEFMADKMLVENKGLTSDSFEGDISSFSPIEEDKQNEAEQNSQNIEPEEIDYNALPFN